MEQCPDAATAAAQASEEFGLAEHRDEALADVERAMVTLEREGLLADDVVRRVEYPVAGAGANGEMLLGYVDFVAVKGDEVWIVDFKTDTVPADRSSVPEQYLRQLHSYRTLVHARRAALAILFTAEGSLIRTDS
jgi:ATP-dependent exoDNAse (exonuclease V) beta subunit